MTSGYIYQQELGLNLFLMCVKDTKRPAIAAGPERVGGILYSS